MMKSDPNKQISINHIRFFSLSPSIDLVCRLVDYLHNQNHHRSERDIKRESGTSQCGDHQLEHHRSFRSIQTNILIHLSFDDQILSSNPFLDPSYQ